MKKTLLLFSAFLLLTSTMFTAPQAADKADEKADEKDVFTSFIQPLFNKSCTKCHGKENPKGKVKINGEVNLHEIKSLKQFMTKPKLIQAMIEAIDANDMPPEDEPQLSSGDRKNLLSRLKIILRQATKGKQVKEIKFFRLNRYQYNNTVRDLFDLNMDVFSLPEKLMTRQSDYLHPKDGKMPNTVKVKCMSLSPVLGMKGVRPYPQDLPAENGFDNQEDFMSLSPLLLDSFLKLSLSIINSKDFNEKTCGIWNDFFKAPAKGVDLNKEVEKRLSWFLSKAFRHDLNQATLQRYTKYVLAKIKSGLSFEEAMKKVASAALCSPYFLYRIKAEDAKDYQFELASKMSYFLWGSGPDKELLDLAKSGKLSDKANLNKSIERMLKDKKVERFLDTFPGQWLQLAPLLGSQPFKKQFSFYYYGKTPTSLQLMPEPLLLFDTVFVENRSVIDLIDPKFSYRNDYLNLWYSLKGQPKISIQDAEKIDKKIITECFNRRKEILTEIATIHNEIEKLTKASKDKIFASEGKPEPVKPYASWDFNNGDLKSSNSEFHLKRLRGKIATLKDGTVFLDGNTCLQTIKPLPTEIKARTLQIWLKLNHLQRHHGAMSLSNKKQHDAFVLGAGKNPNLFSVVQNGKKREVAEFSGKRPGITKEEWVNLTMVCKEDGSTLLYVDGQAQGEFHKRKEILHFPANDSWVILGMTGLKRAQHLNGMTIDKANFYDRALTEAEVGRSIFGADFLPGSELNKVLNTEQKKKKKAYEDKIHNLRVEFSKLKILTLGERQANRQKANIGLYQNAKNSIDFRRVPLTDMRYGGIISNAAVLTATSSPYHSKPIARGIWMLEVVMNDPPPPAPIVPPFDEKKGPKNMTIREKFALHRTKKECASCHSRIDPMGFALENFDAVGHWRDNYKNKRKVNATGTLLKKHKFNGVVELKQALVKEKRRFAKAFIAHILRFALSRELGPRDFLVVDKIADKTEKNNFLLKDIIKEVILSESFSTSRL